MGIVKRQTRARLRWVKRQTSGPLEEKSLRALQEFVFHFIEIETSNNVQKKQSNDRFKKQAGIARLLFLSKIINIQSERCIKIWRGTRNT